MMRGRGLRTKDQNKVDWVGDTFKVCTTQRILIILPSFGLPLNGA